MSGMAWFLAIRSLILGSAMAVPSCSSVVQELSLCLGFLQDAGHLSDSCCSGVTAITKEMKIRYDLAAVCNCVKQVLSFIGPHDTSRIPLLSQKCGMSYTLPPITNDTNCSAVSFGGV